MATVRKQRPPTHGPSIKESVEQAAKDSFVRAETSGDEYDHGFADGLAYAVAIFLNPYKKNDQDHINAINNHLREAALTEGRLRAPKKRVKRNG